MALTLDINLSVGRATTSSGVPSPNLVILTQVGAFMQTEDGKYLEFEF